MSFRQIFDRIARIARAELNSGRSEAYERELRRAQELIEESRGERRTSVEPDDGSSSTSGSHRQPDPEYLEACRVLGVRATATRTEITAAYRSLARDFHPDRVSHLSPEAQKVALNRMQQINLAYELLERRTR
jgi:DnaJ-domain-containing protein 1